MNTAVTKKTVKIRPPFRSWLFPAGVAVVYLILAITWQEQTLVALRSSGRILLQVSLPLMLAFALMFLLNLFISPAQVSKYLGHSTGLKGILLSSVAGMISMGPIYAWYPFLKSLKEKGASDFHLANFLASRAVKPVLLPLMIAYFGLRFSVVFTVSCIVLALLTAFMVHLLRQRP